MGHPMSATSAEVNMKKTIRQKTFVFTLVQREGERITRNSPKRVTISLSSNPLDWKDVRVWDKSP